MEVWRLNHPEFGELVVRIARPVELHLYDPQFPRKDAASPDWEERDSPKNRLTALLIKLKDRRASGKERSMLFTVNGEVRARLKDMERAKVPAKLEADEGEDEPDIPTGTVPIGIEPFIDIDVNLFGEPRSIYFRDRGSDEVALFDVPNNSPAERRFKAMEASPWKRLVFPIMAGMGKAGWALIVILAAPLIERIVTWFLSFLPEINIPWPQINIPWPEINIPWPEINIPWPEISLPSLPALPAWLEWLIDHPKLWMPILIGIVAGILGMRRAKRSAKTRKSWQARQASPDEEKSTRQSPHQRSACRDDHLRDE